MTSSPENLLTVWLGSEITTDIPCNLQIPAEEVTDEYIEAATETIKDKMHSSGYNILKERDINANDNCRQK